MIGWLKAKSLPHLVAWFLYEIMDQRLEKELSFDVATLNWRLFTELPITASPPLPQSHHRFAASFRRSRGDKVIASLLQTARQTPHP